MNQQTYFIGGCHKSLPVSRVEEALQRALANLNRFRFIGLVEYFQLSIAYLQREFDWRGDCVRVNETATKMLTSFPRELEDYVLRHTWADQILYRHVLEVFLAKIGGLPRPSA